MPTKHIECIINRSVHCQQVSLMLHLHVQEEAKKAQVNAEVK